MLGALPIKQDLNVSSWNILSGDEVKFNEWIPSSYQ